MVGLSPTFPLVPVDAGLLQQEHAIHLGYRCAVGEQGEEHRQPSSLYLGFNIGRKSYKMKQTFQILQQLRQFSFQIFICTFPSGLWVWKLAVFFGDPNIVNNLLKFNSECA